MIYDFSFEQCMRLSNIKRWGIIEMSRQQTVAEHSYNVAIISMAMVERAGRPTVTMAKVLKWALIHDLPEVVTGDIPSSLKAMASKEIDKIEGDLFPRYCSHKDKIYREKGIEAVIVKCADWIDAIQFAMKFCCDYRRDDIIREMQVKLSDFIDANEESGGTDLRFIVEGICDDTKILLKSIL